MQKLLSSPYSFILCVSFFVVVVVVWTGNLDRLGATFKSVFTVHNYLEDVY